VLSDTHGSLPAAALEALAGAEHIIHAGDVGSQWVLDELEAVAPVTAVLGNCDDPTALWQLEYYSTTTLAGTRVFVTHTPKDAEEALRGRGAIAPGEPLPHVCIHGHTHIPEVRKVGPVLMLCPGSPCRPRGHSKPSVALLQLQEGHVDARIVEL
jgi:putative phosphoesterase